MHFEIESTVLLKDSFDYYLLYQHKHQSSQYNLQVYLKNNYMLVVVELLDD
ncbi:hypothetical protein [Pseudoalteromonas sp. '520P1 No. 423']|uniref:hypothetical protein n=1 Tax=Pseudoalteromonas sp. '520P1 No. 423' TaxID=1690037 RepID=UPI000AF43E30|nr:hypothetical protein [Pseudoalteromonas sp. '520P1 No. 423']